MTDRPSGPPAGIDRVLAAAPRTTVGAFADQPGTPVTLPGGGAVVVLHRDGPLTAVLEHRAVRHLDPATAAAPVTDPDVAAGLLRDALVWAVHEWLGATDTAARLEQAIGYARDADDAHGRTMAAIREYAIAAHRRGDVGRAGLNQFLARFSLEPYHERYLVRFTVTGSVEVAAQPGSTAEGIAEDARICLAATADEVEGADPDTLAARTSVDAVDGIRR